MTKPARKTRPGFLTSEFWLSAPVTLEYVIDKSQKVGDKAGSLIEKKPVK